MTEGPEATFLADMIYRHFRGKRLLRVRILAGRYKTHGPGRGFLAFQRLLPLRLTDVYKKGKVIFLFFESGWCLIAKMGMTGWFYRGAETEEGKGRPLHRSNPNVAFDFEGGEELLFADFRNFGTLTFTNDVLAIVEEMDRLAPDVLNPYTTYEDIRSRVGEAKPTLSIEQALMDQTLLMSGIGNILKSEVLYEAGVSPRRKVKDVVEAEWRRIVSAAKKVSRKTLAVLEGRKGEDREEYTGIRQVYDRERDPDGNRVLSYRAADGRTTFYVPSVQA
jgi:formamidopyrimidine-DNA glycosylase